MLKEMFATSIYQRDPLQCKLKSR